MRENSRHDLFQLRVRLDSIADPVPPETGELKNPFGSIICHTIPVRMQDLALVSEPLHASRELEKYLGLDVALVREELVVLDEVVVQKSGLRSRILRLVQQPDSLHDGSARQRHVFRN